MNLSNIFDLTRGLFCLANRPAPVEPQQQTPPPEEADADTEEEKN